MKTVKICSIKEFCNLIGNKNFDWAHSVALISSSYPIATEKLKNIQYAWCEYDDLDYQVLGRVMTDVHARKFAKLVQNYRSDITTYICVSDRGVRRSSAIGAALYRFFDSESAEMKIWMNPRFEPNTWIYRLMCVALGCPIGDADLDIRIHENRTAIRTRINHHR